MKNADEKLKDIFVNIFKLPQVKEACYNSIVDNAVPMIIETIKRDTRVSTEEILEQFYAMEEPSELQELVNTLIGGISNFKISQEDYDDILDIIDRKLDEES